jgi:hypothetical protein
VPHKTLDEKVFGENLSAMSSKCLHTMRHDTQHNDIWPDDTQLNKRNDNQHNNKNMMH